MTYVIEACVIETIERMRRVNESERDESRRIPLMAHLRVYELCPRCSGNGCESCFGRGTIEVSR